MFRPLSFSVGLLLGCLVGAAAVIYIPGAHDTFVNLFKKGSKQAATILKKGGETLVSTLTSVDEKEEKPAKETKKAETKA